jgi:hypothetical protein
MIRAAPAIQGKAFYAEAKEVPLLSLPIRSEPSSQGATKNLWSPRMSTAKKAAVQQELAFATPGLFSSHVPTAERDLRNQS